MAGAVSLRRLVLVCGLSVALTVSVAGVAEPAVALTGSAKSGAVARSGDKSVAVRAASTTTAKRRARPAVWVPGAVSWPSAASTVVDLVVQAGGGRRGRALVGGLPVTVSSVEGVSSLRAAAAAADTPSRVKVEVLDRAKVRSAGVVLRLSRADGGSGSASVHVTVGYGSFADAFGAGWASRLSLVQLADCAAMIPAGAGCGASRPVASTVDTSALTVSADVNLLQASPVDTGPVLSHPSPTDDMSGPVNETSVDPYLGSFSSTSGPDVVPALQQSSQTSTATAALPGDGVVLALAAGASDATQDFSQTQLSQSSSWQIGGSSGDFSWSYPISVPPVPGGLTPPIALAYSSAAVDGQTANSNTQPGWIGEGFSYEPGFIERSYRTCRQDVSPVAPYWSTTASMDDLCWRLPNAHLVWNGKSTELVAQDASGSPNTATPSVWRLADDDGTKVEYLSDQGTGRTGYWHDEHWRITTSDGTQYWFGRTRVPGAGTETASVVGEAIMGNHAGEPCFASTAVSDSWCQIAYRWNLDYVVDTHGNAMAYFYNRESNQQQIYGSASTRVGYYRASTLARIEYGLRAGSNAGASARVVFTTADRCWSDCGTHGSNWPDVPWELECTTAPCPTPSPTFWSTQRLIRIDTQVSTGAGAFRTIDSYALASTVPGTGHAGQGGELALLGITRTGQDSGTGVAGASVALPEVSFDYGAAMQNRAFLNAGDTESWKYRLRTIDTDTGGQIQVGYSLDSACLSGSPDPAASNHLRCFPQEYQGFQTWWHKYVVTQVVEHDKSGASPDVVHGYAYDIKVDGLRADGVGAIGSNSGVLWHYDTNAIGSDTSHRTWSQFRGFAVVSEFTGTTVTGSPRTRTVRLYFTGLNADRTAAGEGTRTGMTIVDTDMAAIPDEWWRAGALRQELTFPDDQGTSKPIVKTFHDPSPGVVTATRTITSAWLPSATTTAMFAPTVGDETWTWLAASSTWRKSRSETTYDSDLSDGAYGSVLARSTLGDLSTAADDSCTEYTYNVNVGGNLVRFDGSGTGPTVGTVLADWTGYDRTTATKDFDGDGKTDLFAVQKSTGNLYLFKGDGVGGFDAGTSIASGWNAYDAVIAPGDFTNDGKPDVLARKSANGDLVLFTGNGTGGFATGPVTVGVGFGAFDAMFSPGDFAANGVGDVIARVPDGRLYLYSGNGSGGWTNSQGIEIGHGWGSFQPFGFGDYSGDSWPDILAQGPTGLLIYPGTGSGAISATTVDVPNTYGAAAGNRGSLIATGDVTGDATKDIVQRIDANLTAPIAQTETYAKVCTAAPTYPGDAMSASRMFYDQPNNATPSLTAKPWRADITALDAADKYNAASPNWIRQADTAYDAYGRPTTVKDPYGKTTSTVYTDTFGLTTQTKTTNPLGHMVTTTVAPGRGLPVTVSDPNNNITTGSYDALGRTLKVWKPGHPTSGTPDAEYVYSIGIAAGLGTGVNTVTTKAMGPDGTQITSYQILDGLLHPLQTQTPTADGGRTITDTRYDVNARVAKTSVFYNASPPSATRVTAADTAIDSQHRFTYDGTGRQITDELWSDNVKQWNVTSTSYDGDRTTVDNPTGGTDTTTIVDALGRTVELWQYSASTPTGNHTKTLYGYDHAGQLTSVTGPDGSAWLYDYDLLGRRTSTVDPDAGTTATSYDNAGRVTSTTDARGQVLSYDYDDLGRKTAEYKTVTKTVANQLASWVYDTVPAGKGQLTSSTRYIGGNQVGGSAYTRTVTAYDPGYRPTHTDLTIPAAEGALAGTYGTDYSYNPDGTPYQQDATKKGTSPVGGLPAETLTFGYDAVGRVDSLTGAQTYLSNEIYYFDGQVSYQVLGSGTAQVRHSFTYEPATRRLTSSMVQTGTTNAWTNNAEDTYANDPAGNVQYIAGTTNGTLDQVECFDYDYLRRLTDAWTEAAISCTTKQATGADPYRLEWKFDDTTPDANGIIKTAGLRTKETAYNTDGSTLYQSSYAYGGTGKPPHSLQSVVTTGTGAGTKTYDYDPAGNTLNRPGPGGAQQDLHWDEEGHLDTVTDSTTTSMVYDADGTRIIRKDPGGYKTLTLPDGTELRSNGAGSVAGTRYYSGLATRTANTDSSGNLTGGTTLTWTISDHHGTGTIAINPTTLAVDRRRSLPYGQPRGIQATGFGTKGFVGGTTDPTGLTHLGAREYDPTTGRFISIDPLFDGADPQSWNGYAYSNNAPATSADPSGMQFCDDCEEGGEPGGDRPSPSGGGNNNACDAECEKALLLLQQKKLVDRTWEKGIKAALVQQLADYVNTLGTNGAGACIADAMVSSGVAAACNQLMGTSPQYTWQDLVKMFLNGPGANIAFDQNSPLTQQLAADPHNMNLVATLYATALASGFTTPLEDLGGADDYNDPTTPSQFLKDRRGMNTDGKEGTSIPDAFTGSYDLVYQVVNENPKSKSITIAFAAFNDTGVASLTHVVPDLNCTPCGGGISVYQEYYWLVTVTP